MRLDLDRVTLKSGAHNNPQQGLCVIWTGRTDNNGYGLSGRKRAHRVAWEKAHGRPIPAGLVVMHSCDNPPCVNPAHLSLGTVADNNKDRANKGRSKGTFPAGDKHPARVRRGSAHWATKLTEEDVRSIRLRHGAGESQSALAREFHVHSATVSRIVRRVWRQEVY